MNRSCIVGAIVAISFLATVGGCNRPPEPRPTTPREAALARVRDVANEAGAGAARVVSEVFDAKGDFQYIVIRLSVAGSLSRLVAVDREGQLSSLRRASLAFAQNHTRDWGVLDIESARRLATGLGVTDEAYLAFYSEGEGESAIAVFRDLGITAWRAAGLPAVRFQADATGALQVAKSGALSRVVYAGQGRGIPSAVPAYPPNEADAPPHIPSSALTTSSDHYFEQEGFRGNGIKIGIAELTKNSANEGCRIYDDHEAFSHAGMIDYLLTTPVGCSSDGQCGVCAPASDSGLTARCIAGQCVSEHGTAVASRILSAQDAGPDPEQIAGAFHAAEADLYVANNFSVMAVANEYYMTPTTDDLIEAYNYFAMNEVQIVNESWTYADDNRHVADLLRDYHARKNGILFVQSAGNLQQGEDDLAQLTVRCLGFNSLCVGATKRTALNARSVVAHRLWSGSRWANPISPFTGPGLFATRLEQEKPDLVAEGELGHYAVVDAASTNKWDSTLAGTSAAAPVVAGLAALQLQACPDRGGVSTPLAIRALFRTSGTWQLGNAETNLPSGYPPTCMGTSGSTPAYPAPHLNEWDPTRPNTTPAGDLGDYCDYKTGTGVIQAAFLPNKNLRQCETSASCVGAGCDPGIHIGDSVGKPIGDGSDGWDPVDSDPFPPSDDDTNESDHRAGSTSLPLRQQRLSLTPFWRQLWDFRKQDYAAGSRIRASLSFYSCPGLTSDEIEKGQDPAAELAVLSPAVNFDLVLRGKANGSWSVLIASESLHDTNEGFDITLTEDYEALELRLVAPSDWASCAIPAKGINPGEEPFSIDMYATRIAIP